MIGLEVSFDGHTACLGALPEGVLAVSVTSDRRDGPGALVVAVGGTTFPSDGSLVTHTWIEGAGARDVVVRVVDVPAAAPPPVRTASHPLAATIGCLGALGRALEAADPDLAAEILAIEEAWRDEVRAGCPVGPALSGSR